MCKLSIVIPVFNHPDLVAEMVESIFQNTFNDWELLMVDDGSDKTTVSVLRGFEAKDDRVHVFIRDIEPKGAQTCRNIGLGKASGEYIVFFDSDDMISPCCLESRVRFLDSHPHLDFVVTPSGLLKDHELFIGVHEHVFGFPIYSDPIKAFARRTLPFVVCNNTYRRSSLTEHRLQWNTQLKSLQDADFNLNCMIVGMKFDFANASPDYFYRIDTSSSVSKKAFSEEHHKSRLLATESFYELIQGKYSHRYDSSLYQGVLSLYNLTYSDSIDFTQVKDLVQVVCCYNKFYGRLFAFQVRITKILASFLPAKIARQIPMVFYLLQYRLRRKRKLKRISNIL